MLTRLYALASPPRFYRLADLWSRWLLWCGIALLLPGLWFSLLDSPPDYQQGESVRIMYVHVPAAWLSMFGYVCMATMAGIGLIFRSKAASAVAHSCAPAGAAFTFLALVTGSLWGKPMWGTWWIWDARLTSELVLLFLYFGYLGLKAAIEDREAAARATAVLALVGVVNIPIIHYSVEWWNTLHQGPTVTKLDKPSIHLSMLLPLLLMSFSYMALFGAMVLRRARGEILLRERNSGWVRELAMGEKA